MIARLALLSALIGIALIGQLVTPQGNPRHRELVQSPAMGVVVQELELDRRRIRLGQVERAGIHRTYLSDVERGTRNLSPINIERLAEALALKLSELFSSVEER